MLTRIKEIAYDSAAKKFQLRDTSGRKLNVPLGSHEGTGDMCSYQNGQAAVGGAITVQMGMGSRSFAPGPAHKFVNDDDDVQRTFESVAIPPGFYGVPIDGIRMLRRAIISVHMTFRINTPAAGDVRVKELVTDATGDDSWVDYSGFAFGTFLALPQNGNSIAVSASGVFEVEEGWYLSGGSIKGGSASGGFGAFPAGTMIGNDGTIMALN